MDILPEHIINKIMLYISHPLADLIKDSEAYKDYNEECSWLSGEPQSFSEYYFLQYSFHNCCGACIKPYRDCQCWCSRCGREVSECKYICYNRKYCSSCDSYYHKDFICCPRCD